MENISISTGRCVSAWKVSGVTNSAASSSSTTAGRASLHQPTRELDHLYTAIEPVTASTTNAAGHAVKR